MPRCPECNCPEIRWRLDDLKTTKDKLVMQCECKACGHTWAQEYKSKTNFLWSEFTNNDWHN